MNHRILFFPLALVLLASCCRYPEPVREVDRLLKNEDIYEQAFQNKVSMLKFSLVGTTDTNQLYRLRSRLSEEYKYYSFDSTQFYLMQNLSLANRLGDSFKIIESRIAIADNYVTGGYYQESLDLLNQIGQENVPPDLLQKYVYTRLLVYRNLRDNAPNGGLKTEYQAEFEACMEQLLPLVEEGSYIRKYLIWEESRNRDDYDAGIPLALDMIAAAREGTHDYSEAGYFASLSYKSSGDDEGRWKWVAEGAKNDIRMASRNYWALVDLTGYFFKVNDVSKLFEYVILHALPDAQEYNGKNNLWGLTRYVKAVQVMYRQQSMRRRALLMELGIVSGLLLLVCIFLLIQSLRHNRILAEAQKELLSANRVKEEYISSFITMISENSASRYRFLNHIVKMIRQGKTAELMKEAEDLADKEQDAESFNEMFDTTFLSLYPDFVASFNSLLRPEEAIIPKQEGSLTPELRIYALAKLGVTDPRKVAVLLRYSQNTVYNYRVKVRGKARMSKEEFDRLSMSL